MSRHALHGTATRTQQGAGLLPNPGADGSNAPRNTLAARLRLLITLAGGQDVRTAAALGAPTLSRVITMGPCAAAALLLATAAASRLRCM